MNVRSRFSMMIGPNAKVTIGDDVFFNNDCSVNCLDSIKIGSNCIIGENVKIYDHDHRFRDIDKPIQNQGYITSPVTIGSNCWIGSNVIVLRGSSIGDSCVIGAGSIIKSDIPDRTIVRVKQNQILDVRSDSMIDRKA